MMHFVFCDIPVPYRWCHCSWFESGMSNKSTQMTGIYLHKGEKIPLTSFLRNNGSFFLINWWIYVNIPNSPQVLFPSQWNTHNFKSIFFLNWERVCFDLAIYVCCRTIGLFTQPTCDCIRFWTFLVGQRPTSATSDGKGKQVRNSKTKWNTLVSHQHSVIATYC